MSFKLLILGSSSALPTSERFSSAHVLNVHEQIFLLDCGEGTQIQLRKYKVRFGKINHIFISHLHGDHTFGLFGLISTFNLLGRKNDLHIYAHKNLEKILQYHFKYFDTYLNFKILFHEIDHKKEEIIYSDKHIEVLAFPLKHRIECSGFLFKEFPKLRNLKKQVKEKYNIPIKAIQPIKEGKDFITEEGKVIKNIDLTLPPYHSRSYAYCTDTIFIEKIVPIIKEVDLLYHEATYMDELKELAKTTYHSTAKQAAEIALKAGVKKLILGHFSARYKDLTMLLNEAKSVFSNSYLAKEGDSYVVELYRKQN